jgi:AraC-like DNA-binding protein
VFLSPGTPHTTGETSHFETISADRHYCALLWLKPVATGVQCRMCHAQGEQHRGSAEGEQIYLHNPRLLQLFSLLNEEVGELAAGGGSKKDGSPLIFESLLLVLMRTIVRDMERGHFFTDARVVDKPGYTTQPHDVDRMSASDDPIAQAIAYVNSHCTHPLVIDDVARRFFVSRAHFTRKFREYTGQSFLSYLTELRLQQARNLLTETDWTTVMIGRFVGFKSTAHFHSVFLRDTGVSPKDYRERVLQKKRTQSARSHSKEHVE